MFNRDNRFELVENENAIAQALLQELLVNYQLKNTLQEIMTTMREKIIKKIITSFSHASITQLSDLSPSMQNTISMLARHNVKNRIYFGGVLPEFETIEEILSSLENIKELLNRLEYYLTDVSNIKDIQTLLKTLEAIADLSTCYIEYLTDLHSDQYTKIRDMIWLTPEELDGRIFRDEIGEKKKLALTYGIGTDSKKDLCSANFRFGLFSGKAIFAGASMKKRLSIIVKQYDNATEIYDSLKQQILRCNAEDKSKLQTQITEFAKDKLMPLIEKMQCYNIPLINSERQNISVYAKRHKTTFEKLMRDTKTNSFLPITANISRSSARTLMTLCDLYAFISNNELDVNKLQYFANIVMAFYVYCGHHSFSEVAEIYNRVLDYYILEKLDDKITTTSDVPYFNMPDIPEKTLPYYHFGDYNSFLHKDYVDKILDKAMQNPNLPKPGLHF